MKKKMPLPMHARMQGRYLDPGKTSALVAALACLAARGVFAQAVPPQAASGALNAGQTVLPTVQVNGTRDDGYRVRNASVAGFGSAPLLDTPSSVSVVSRAQMDDQQSKLVSDVVRNDASVGNDYAPVGYYEDFSIRGFPIDLARAGRLGEWCRGAGRHYQFCYQARGRRRLGNAGRGHAGGQL
jgi:outer membrane receptor for ferric coprogen and ferric-rhodotorulic acid